MNGAIIDIGCGSDKVSPQAMGVDIRKTPAVDQVVTSFSDLISMYSERFDVVFSSHCLEHIPDDIGALKDWGQLLKSKGVLILYLPDVRYYTQPNPDHVHNYTYDSFMFDIPKLIPGFDVVESGMDLGDDKYSFFVVLSKQ